MFKNMNWNKGNKRHLFRKLGIYDKIGKKWQHKIVAFQSQWCNSCRFTFYCKAGSLHLKRHFAKVLGSGYHLKLEFSTYLFFRWCSDLLPICGWYRSIALGILCQFICCTCCFHLSWYLSVNCIMGCIQKKFQYGKLEVEVTL